MKYFYIEQALILKKTPKENDKSNSKHSDPGPGPGLEKLRLHRVNTSQETHTHTHKHTQCAQPNPSQSSSFSVIHAAAVHCWKNREIVLHMFSCRNKCWRSGQMKKKPRRPSTSTETHFYLLQVHTHRRTAETQACQ